MDLLADSPNDGELNQALKDLSARKTLDQGGYGALESGQGSYRDILKDKQQAVSLEQEKRVVKNEDVTERLIGEDEARLKTEPNNLKLVRRLAELYTQKKQFDDALALYDRIKNSDMGNDPSLERAMSDTIVRRFDFQIEQLDPAAPDYAEQSAKLQAEKLDFQMTDCQKRVEKYPTDLAIRFEMGQLYFQAGKIGEAIQEFQKAQQNPNKRLAAMGFLAQCFAKRKMFDLAARTLQNAIKEKLVFDDEKKDLVYNLGCVFESMGKKDEAIEQFKYLRNGRGLQGCHRQGGSLLRGAVTACAQGAGLNALLVRVEHVHETFDVVTVGRAGLFLAHLEPGDGGSSSAQRTAQDILPVRGFFGGGALHIFPHPVAHLAVGDGIFDHAR